jgi:hypothetical protein
MLRSAPPLRRGALLIRGRNGVGFVMRGLDPRIHHLRKTLSEKDGRPVKPGHDASIVTVPALRSSVKNAAPRPGQEIYVASGVVAHPPAKHSGNTIPALPGERATRTLRQTGRDATTAQRANTGERQCFVK